MEGPEYRPDAEASLGDAQSANPPDDPDYIEADADPLDTDVEDADLFLGEGEEGEDPLLDEEALGDEDLLGDEE